MRALNKVFRLASYIANDKSEPLDEKHVFQARAWRTKLQKGEVA